MIYIYIMITDNFILNILLIYILINKLSLIFIHIFDKILIKKKILSDEKIVILEEFLYKSFYISMSILLILLFNPIYDIFHIYILNEHVKHYLFLFGILIFISNADLLEIIKKKLNLN